ncbi:RrF2 family transcriptional regulator [Kaistia terrae]|uniref:RrF2 family transcriptional regulator n=1 Tax=Kaistia terrae TaxID=537017 RepID=A0ABW0PYD5_9HYPH|nr:Rrf2 family transcriptional regulator [Kaistia terrae]MCX5580872.1 Rrf2 family transcriptional regulator [Kaistia terrae]
MHISAKSDYATRAMIEIAAANGVAIKCEAISRTQSIPLNFLVNILSDLRRGGLVNSQRGADGGYWLARPAETISVGEVIRVVEGEMVLVRGIEPQSLDYNDLARPLRDVWIAYRASVLKVLDTVSLAALASGELPETVLHFSRQPEAWRAG